MATPVTTVTEVDLPPGDPGDDVDLMPAFGPTRIDFLGALDDEPSPEVDPVIAGDSRPAQCRRMMRAIMVLGESIPGRVPPRPTAHLLWRTPRIRG